jgi:hypothetical protein
MIHYQSAAVHSTAQWCASIICCYCAQAPRLQLLLLLLVHYCAQLLFLLSSTSTAAAIDNATVVAATPSHPLQQLQARL